MKLKVKRILVAALVLLAGCGTGPAAGQADKAHNAYRLVVSGGSLEQRVEVLTTARHDRPFLLPGGIVSDGRLYSIGWGSAGGTSVRVYDTGAGRLLKTRDLRGNWQTEGGGISPGGRWLVLARPSPPDRTAFAVLRTDLGGEPATVDLAGRFAFDAITDDGRLLYLLEYLQGTKYQVRVYDVRQGVLQAHAVVAKGPEVEVMSGTRQTAVADASGDRLYSLYMRNGKPPFVHVLDLDGQYAYCIDFPALPAVPGYDPGAPEGWSLALDSAHQRLYAVLGQGLVVSIRTDRLSVADVRTFAGSKARDRLPGASAVDASGATLFVAGDSGALRVDTRRFEATALASLHTRLTDLVLSSDGRRLFAVSPAERQVIAIDPTSGEVLDRLDLAAGDFQNGARILAAVSLAESGKN